MRSTSRVCFLGLGDKLMRSGVFSNVQSSLQSVQHNVTSALRDIQQPVRQPTTPSTTSTSSYTCHTQPQHQSQRGWECHQTSTATPPTTTHTGCNTGCPSTGFSFSPFGDGNNGGCIRNHNYSSFSGGGGTQSPGGSGGQNSGSGSGGGFGSTLFNKMLEWCSTSHAHDIARRQGMELKDIKFDFAPSGQVTVRVDAPNATTKQIEALGQAVQQECPVARFRQTSVASSQNPSEGMKWLPQ